MTVARNAGKDGEPHYDGKDLEDDDGGLDGYDGEDEVEEVADSDQAEQDEDYDEEDEDAPEPGEDAPRRLPWHFKFLAVATVIYLGYRLFQGITWLIHHA